MDEQKQHRFKISFNSPVVLSFAFLCFVATLLGVISKQEWTHVFFATYRSSFANPLTYVRMFTHVIGHSGWQHFFNNMSLFLLLGPLLEEKYGSKNLIEVICVTAVITAILNRIFFANIALTGASGVVFALILLASMTSFKEGEIPITFILVVMIYLGQEIYSAIFAHDNISNLSHVLGGVIGAISGFAFNKEKKE